MSISDVEALFKFAGGIGMFLYGMNIMSDGMQKSAGKKMSSLLAMLTSKRIMGVLVGALVTAIIQSSGATTVMVVGFVNAGIMSLTQGVGVIMGANIGTTATSWLVSMSQLGDAAKVLQPSFFAPLLIGIGAFVVLFAKTNNKKTVGEIVVGLGLLFVGLSFMSSSVSPYTSSPIFSTAFTVLGKNPLLGVLVGLVVTAILQSSSASVGILQSLALNGVVTFNAAIFITLGQNIGSCVTCLLSAIGASRNAKRAACIHFLFNVVGAIIFGLGFFLYFTLFNRALATSNITSVQISIFHTVFNITNTIILFPFAGKLEKLSGFIIREKEAGPEDAEFDEVKLVTESVRQRLDTRILSSAAFAIETASHEMHEFGLIGLGNIQDAIESVCTLDKSAIERVHRTEAIMDAINDVMNDYLVKIDQLSLTPEQQLQVTNMFYATSDIERISDLCDNIAEFADDMIVNGQTFSETGIKDIRNMGKLAQEAVQEALYAYLNKDLEAEARNAELEGQVNEMEKQLRKQHIERLAQGQCNASAGVLFLDVISNIERISDHGKKIGEYVIDELEK